MQQKIESILESDEYIKIETFLLNLHEISFEVRISQLSNQQLAILYLIKGTKLVDRLNKYVPNSRKDVVKFEELFLIKKLNVLEIIKHELIILDFELMMN